MSDNPNDVELQSALDKIEYYRLEFEGVDRAKRDLQDVLGAFEPRWKYIRLAALRLIEERDASKALCDEMAKEIERLRDANRKLHRRAQLGEGLFATVKFDLEMWIATLSSPPRDTSVWLFRYALRHMERAVGRYHQKIELAENTSSQEILNG